MTPLLSQRKYAVHRGVTLRAVQKAIQAGRITLVIDPATKKPKIDPAIADAQWVRNTDIEQQLRGNGGVLPTGPASSAGSAAAGLELGAGGASDLQGEEEGGDREEMLRHKTSAAKADAQLKTMAVLERAGELVDADEVRREFQSIARSTRNAVLAIPDRVAQVLDPTNPERARKLLDTEIRKALREISAELERAATAAEGEATLQ